MTPIFVDTDILIDYSKGHGRALESLLAKQEQGDVELYINPVVMAEFFTDRSLRDERIKTKAQEFLQLFSLKEITKQIGLMAGDLLRDEKANHLGDAMIAATCIVYHLLLVTRNTKHFRNISSLQFYQQ